MHGLNADLHRHSLASDSDGRLAPSRTLLAARIDGHLREPTAKALAPVAPGP